MTLMFIVLISLYLMGILFCSTILYIILIMVASIKSGNKPFTRSRASENSIIKE